MQCDLLPTEIHLHRIDPARNMQRFYLLSLQRNLFGEWVLLREWGRIGHAGRTKEAYFADPGSAVDALQKLARVKERRGYR
jgi:predicted DNA-binding WGR domain protein